ncbi:hypothetical protein K469DRAFT_699341 [Zopfia rhizophila CBS 207.26]|uniref:Uncharacterized protein n=1 Tax=Zopfia rhizophila CBS 207.26 TaxID=1314779 RepID=A0A6A6EXS0_9PEZI|nr:hypothetical protein K469DRAFT_699341 [Zopfia rhizophila CBS 207.26]
MSDDITPRALDITARSIDLASIVIKHGLISLVTEASKHTVTEVIKWLARERISETAFVYTMELGLNRAQPNRNGELVLNRLPSKPSGLYGLQLVMPPGALGRAILYDQKLCWVATTVVIVSKYHSRDYAVDALCDLFITTNLSKNDPRVPATDARVRPVITKLVDSLHLHTVNMGQRGEELPERLAVLPRHYLSGSVFAEVVNNIQRLAGSDILVKMQGCIIDILDWMFHHWHGKFTVSANNEKLYDGQLGDSSNQLIVLMESHCGPGVDCPYDHVGHIEIVNLVGSLEPPRPMYQGKSKPGGVPEKEDRSSYRSEFYDIRNPYQTRYCNLLAKEEKEAVQCAQDIVRSILDLPVMPDRGGMFEKGVFGKGPLCLKIDRESTTPFHWWLKQKPTLLAMELGHQPSRGWPFRSDLDPSELEEEYDPEEGYYPLENLSKWYPGLADAMRMARNNCACGCRSTGEELLDDVLNDGCRMTLMATEILLYIAHAMAEAAGAADISNYTEPDHLSQAATALLGCIAVHRMIYWDTWFRLAACAATGMPHDTTSDDISDGILLWVTGSITIAPLWLNFDQEIVLKGSWGIQQMTGTIPGLGDEKAVVESQRSSTATASMVPDLGTTNGREDSEEVKVQGFVYANTADLYQLMWIAQTSKALRIFNPIEIYQGAMLAIRPPGCSHAESDVQVAYSWLINDILLGWNLSNTLADLPGNYPHVAMLANSPLKQNIALGCATYNCVLQGGDCCFCCLAQTAQREGCVGIWCGNQGRQRRLQ